ncbi:MAG TPA: hypothetical protein VGS80_11255 [Ktedonobacterales bacterium]|nr:hypothetical protein [Ktedonobacterales bacterium]
MDLDDFMIAVFCWVDAAIPAVLAAKRLRQRGPCPVLADSEVVTMAVVGEYLGLAQDRALFAYCRRHSAHCFPRLRTSQAAHAAPHHLRAPGGQPVVAQSTPVAAGAGPSAP